MADIHVVRADRRIEGKFNEGWGYAAIICALAVACAVSAWWIHERTYHHPTDVRFHAPGSVPAGGGHGAPAAGH